jgi:hypothetical protein
MESGYYPPGAEFDSNAPYNQVDPEEKEIEVTVSMTISKTFTINVTDYEEEYGIDEDGHYHNVDYSNCDLHSAVKDQITLPTDLPLFVKRIFNADLDLKSAKMPLCLKQAINDCEYWDIDDFEVIQN